MHLSFLYSFASTSILLATKIGVSAHAIPATSTATTTTTTITAPSTSPTHPNPPAPKSTPSYHNTSVPIAVAKPSTPLPNLPLQGNTLNSVQSLLTLILSIPDSALSTPNVSSSSNDPLSDFLTGLSTCLSDPLTALSLKVSSAIPLLSSLIDEIDTSLQENASKVTSIFASITSGIDVPGAVSRAESALFGFESKVTAVLPVATTEAGKLVNGVESVVQGVGEAIHSAATKVISGVEGVAIALPTEVSEAVKHVGSEISELVKDIDIELPFLAIRSSPHLQTRSKSIEDTLSTLSDITACISNTLESNPVFKVADCAFNLASFAVPVLGRLRAIRRLVAVLGGEVRTVQRLGGVDVDGKDRGNVDGGVDGGDGLGKEVLDLLGELSGVSDLVEACKFIFED